MPVYYRHYGPGQLQFITSTTYRRVPIFANPAHCSLFVRALQAARFKFGFGLVGWVLMPEHFHLLLQPSDPQLTSAIVKDVKQRSAAWLLQALRLRPEVAACQRVLRSLRLPASVRDQAHYRAWQRRFVPFGVFTEKKMMEKLDYMHNNPVKRRLVATPGDWLWSSWRFYYLGDRSILEMDCVGSGRPGVPLP